MDLLAFAFYSPYDQASLAVTVVALTLHLVGDWLRRRRSQGKP
jgi:hypothetical protein